MVGAAWPGQCAAGRRSCTKRRGMGRMRTHRQPARLPVGWEFGSFAMNAAIPQDHKKKERDLPLFYLRIEEH